MSIHMTYMYMYMCLILGEVNVYVHVQQFCAYIIFSCGKKKKFRMKKPLYGMLYQKYTVHRYMYMSIKMCLFSDQKATSSVSGIQLV